jgi:hypothetical protein
VAQAETVVIANVNAQITVPTATYTNVPYQSESLDAYGEYNNSTGVFTAKRAGNYFIAASMFWLNSTWGATNIYLNVYKNGSLIVENLRQIPAGTTYHLQESSVSISLAVGDTLYVSAYQGDTANRFIAGNSSFSRLSISRFPSSSELVVTPERQNTWAGVVYDDSYQLLFSGTPANAASFLSYNDVTWNKPTKLKGKASVTTTNSGNDLGFSVDQLPVGNYKVTLTNGIYPSSGLTDGNEVLCIFRIRETTTGTVIARTVLYDARYSALRQSRDGFGVLDGVFSQTSIAKRNFILEVAKQADSNASNQASCNAVASSAVSVPNILSFTIIPLDQPSNSALYVQGPVLGAQTGAAISSGYVGEVKRLSSGVVNVPASNAWFTVGAGIPLPAGVWSCSASMAYNRNGASFTSVGNMIQTFSESNTTGSTYHWERQGIGRSSDAVPTTFTTFNVGIRPIVFYSNGSQLTWPDGVQRGTNTLYTNGFLGVFTVGTPQYISETECVRLN